MAVHKETQTQQGTKINIEVHKSPSNIAGVVAHWGDHIENDDLRRRIEIAHPGKSLPKDTGFTSIYHQRDNISRSEAIVDELEVASIVALQTLAANNWEPESISGLFVGSGVPVADDERYTDYAAVIARRIGLPSDIYLHSTYAACNSGARELFNALEHPGMQGKRVLTLGIEGVTALTPDFDPEKSDHLSMQVFSNGAAGIGFVPGKEISLIYHRHEISPDERGALSAHMTYKKLLSPEGTIWQENGNISLMSMPVPEGEKLLHMKGVQTTSLFVRRGQEFISNLYHGYSQRHSDRPPEYAVAHHASKGVNSILQKRLASEGLTVEFPWVVPDGNSSAATTLIAHNRLLERAEDETQIMVVSYGAGASFDGGIITYHGRE